MRKESWILKDTIIQRILKNYCNYHLTNFNWSEICKTLLWPSVFFRIWIRIDLGLCKRICPLQVLNEFGLPKYDCAHHLMSLTYLNMTVPTTWGAWPTYIWLCPPLDEFDLPKYDCAHHFMSLTYLNMTVPTTLWVRHTVISRSLDMSCKSDTSAYFLSKLSWKKETDNN